MKTIFLLSAFTLFVFAVDAQKFNGSTFVTSEGITIQEGDTLQLGKGQMGKHYKYINYKYVGMPSVAIKKRGPANADNEGTVLFVDKVSARDGLLVLRGIPYYKFECQAVEAFKSGELKIFSTTSN